MEILEHINTPLAIVAMLIGFGVLIFVHELGHFLVAKWVGIKCTQFAIGFGPPMAVYRQGLGIRFSPSEAELERRVREHLSPEEADSEHTARGHHEDWGGAGEEQSSPGPSQAELDRAMAELGLGETEYRLNWLPLGGYVKMLGQEDLDPAARSEDPRSYNSKPIWARACVISAGVVMNLIFGLLFFIAAFMSGVQFPANVIGDVSPGMPASRTFAEGHEGEPAYRGLRTGDTITHINGEPIRDWMEIRIASALGHPETPIEFTVDRPGYGQPLRYTMRPEHDERERLLSVGIAPATTLRVQRVIVDSPAYEAGVRPGMRVKSVAGEPVETLGEYRNALADHRGQPVPVVFAGEVQVDKEEESEDSETPETVRREVELVQAARPILVDHHRPPHLAGLVPATEVSGVIEDAPADELGVESGDVIARIGPIAWPSNDELMETVRGAEGQPLTLQVYRDGELRSLEPVVPTRRFRARYAQIGIELVSYLDEPIIAATLPGTPAAALEIPAGSRVIELGGESVASWADMQRVLGGLEPTEGEVELEVIYELPVADRARETATLRLTADEVRELAHAGWQVPRGVGFHPLYTQLVGANPVAATVLGVEKTHQFMTHVYVTILRLVQGTVEMEQLRGPVGIVDEGRRIFDRGFAYYLFFLGLISVNLAVINFLPIPIVDGGHIVFLIIEKITGSPPGPRVQTAAALLGLVLIGAVFITVTFYDIARLFEG